MGQKEKLIKQLKSIPGQTIMWSVGTGGIDLKNTMEYKGYVGSVEFSEEDGIFFGKVMGIRSLISYEGTDARSLVEDFHGAVDDYLLLCEENGKIPEKAYKGSFNIRIAPETHKKLVIHATACQMSLNEYVRETLEKAVM